MPMAVMSMLCPARVLLWALAPTTPTFMSLFVSVPVSISIFPSLLPPLPSRQLFNLIQVPLALLPPLTLLLFCLPQLSDSLLDREKRVIFDYTFLVPGLATGVFVSPDIKTGWWYGSERIETAVPWFLGVGVVACCIAEAHI